MLGEADLKELATFWSPPLPPKSALGCRNPPDPFLPEWESAFSVSSLVCFASWLPAMTGKLAMRARARVCVCLTVRVCVLFCVQSQW